MAQPLILIIDDSESLRELLQLRLESKGYRVMTASGGEEGLKMAGENTFDLIICDILMPKMNGFAVCQEIRKDGGNIPFLFLTGKSEAESTVMGLHLGADDYMVKPFDPAELEIRLQKLLRRKP